MPFLKRKVKLDASGGVQAHTTQGFSGSNQVLHALNANFDRKLGGIVGREGSNQVNDMGSYPVDNLFVYKYGATKKYLGVFDNTTNTKIQFSASDNFAGSWSDAKNLGTGRDVFFENFIGKVFYFTGQDQPQMSNDLDASPTWSDVTNAPTAAKFPFVLNQRLHALTEDGFLWSSDVVDSTGLAFETTEWTSRGINPNDGQKCKMALRHRGRGVLIKEESIYTYDGNNEPEANITVGTHSGKSVIIGADGMLYFHHPTAIYAMDTGLPYPISRAVDRWLRNMSSANWETVVATRDDRNVFFSIGDVTITDVMEYDYGRTYSDVVLVYNVYTQRWTVYTGWDMTCAFYDEVTNKTYFGQSDGVIVQMHVAYADVRTAGTSAIPFEVIPHPEDYGYPEKLKNWGLVAVTGRLQQKIRVAGSYKELLTKKALTAEMKNGIAELSKKQSFYELWILIAESYNKTPPIVREIIQDKVEIFDDTK